MHTAKIVIVTDAWHPQINGVVTTLTQTIDHLRSRGFEVITITPDRFKTIPCPTYPEIRLSVAGSRRLKTIISAAAPQSIHIATEGPLGWAARKACLSLGLPFTTSYHTRFPEYIRLRLPVPLGLSYAILRRFHNRAARILVATEQLKDELVRKGFTNVRIWSRGVDTELFKPRQTALFPADKPVFTYVGRVAPEKNIEAFLSLDLPGLKCVIGGGPALAEMQKRYPEVIFAGYLTGEDLACHLAASRVFVFPSLTDTFGVVQLEAMASGVPVAAYPGAATQALIRNGVNGWIDQDLKQAALNCLDLKPDICRRSALDYSWERCTKQFLDNLAFHPACQPAAAIPA